jgi:hypothetical protein
MTHDITALAISSGKFNFVFCTHQNLFFGPDIDYFSGGLGKPLEPKFVGFG